MGVDRQVNKVQSEREMENMIYGKHDMRLDFRSDNGNVIFCGPTNEPFLH